MKIGIIGSSGGSAFNEVVSILQTVPGGKYEYLVITDRACGLESICVSKNINKYRIEEKNNRLFSIEAKHIFDRHGGVDIILLFFSRLVTRELFGNYPTFNIHPALLPAFKGLNAVKKALKEKVRFLGCTLHVVDESVDGGIIIAQSSIPIKSNYTEAILNKISFIQKVYLSLLLIELFGTHNLQVTEQGDVLIVDNLTYSDRFNPCISNPWFLKGLIELQKREKIEVIF